MAMASIQSPFSSCTSSASAGAFGSSRSSVFRGGFLPLRPYAAALPRTRLRASKSLICVAVTWWTDASREIQPEWQKLQNLRAEVLEGSKSASDVPSVESSDMSLWANLKSAAGDLFNAGLTPEVVIGRTAMLGFLSASTVEFETGQSVLQQLTFRGDIFALVLAVGVLLMSMQRQDENGSAVLFNRSELFSRLAFLNPTAERLNGQAAMLGFAAMVAIESAKGSALF